MHKLLSRLNYYRIGSNFNEESAGFAQPNPRTRTRYGGLYRAFVERVNPAKRRGWERWRRRFVGWLSPTRAPHSAPVPASSQLRVATINSGWHLRCFELWLLYRTINFLARWCLGESHAVWETHGRKTSRHPRRSDDVPVARHVFVIVMSRSVSNS